MVAFGSQFSFFTFQTTHVLWAEQLILPGQPDAVVQQTVGAALTFVGIVQIITQFWLVGPFARRFGEKKLAVGGNLVRGIAFAAMAIAPTLAAWFSVIPLIAIGGGLALPALVALLTYAAPPGGRGQVIGLYQSFSALGSILGPLLAGFLFQAINPGAPVAAAAALMGVTVAIGLGLFRQPLAKPALPRTSD